MQPLPILESDDLVYTLLRRLKRRNGKDHLQCASITDGDIVGFWVLEDRSPVVVFVAVTSEGAADSDPGRQPSADALGIARTVDFGAGVDLARAREMYPDLSALWDRIRHDYWASFESGRRLWTGQ
ncbi:hypothetical protein D5S18_15885 [Nocardia panacis]|uniref:Uncharacterized protein n=1 Tax=Nocardia panacis TaxID=2340916 RepID=A0A3A4KA60_9NOCA|nr:hypothetical protein [Nocardia panacis]RJO74895.1 hypothetical protein D5S18_15885 [Nocardia panacis]